MIVSKFVNLVVGVFVAVTLVFSATLIMLGPSANSDNSAYNGLFDNVAEINITIVDSDWENLVANASAKEYLAADISINGTTFSSVGLRAKGNNSLRSVPQDSDRYSLQINPDKYVDGQTIFGLDSLALNNLYGDNSYLKDYVTYQMMDFLEVPAPLYGFAFVKINGEVLGLYGMVERYDDSWLDRNFGDTSGELYNVKMGDNQGDDSLREFFNQDDSTGSNSPALPNFGGEVDVPSFGPDNTFTQGFPPTGDATFTEGIPRGGAPGFGGGEIPNPNDNTFTEGMPGGGFDENSVPLPSGDETSNPVDNTFTEGAPASRPEFGGDTTFSEGFPATEGEPIADATFSGRAREMDDGMGGGRGGGFGGGFGSGNGGDLVYQGTDTASYSAIFNNAVSKVSDQDKSQVIAAIESINTGEDLEQHWDVDEVLRYLAVHTFVVNMDSYSGQMQQNYYLFEKDGVLQILPWDYNYAFGSFQMGGRGGGSSSSSFIDFPIDSPVAESISLEDRPLINTLLSNETYRETYHNYLKLLAQNYVLGGSFDSEADSIQNELQSYIDQDTNAFTDPTTQAQAVTTLKTNVAARALSVISQLEGKTSAQNDE